MLIQTYSSTYTQREVLFIKIIFVSSNNIPWMSSMSVLHRATHSCERLQSCCSLNAPYFSKPFPKWKTLRLFPSYFIMKINVAINSLKHILFILVVLFSQGMYMLYFNRCCQVTLKDTGSVYKYLCSYQLCVLCPLPHNLHSTECYLFVCLFTYGNLIGKMGFHWFNLHFLTTATVEYLLICS